MIWAACSTCRSFASAEHWLSCCLRSGHIVAAAIMFANWVAASGFRLIASMRVFMPRGTRAGQGLYSRHRHVVSASRCSDCTGGPLVCCGRALLASPDLMLQYPLFGTHVCIAIMARRSSMAVSLAAIFALSPPHFAPRLPRRLEACSLTAASSPWRRAMSAAPRRSSPRGRLPRR